MSIEEKLARKKERAREWYLANKEITKKRAKEWKIKMRETDPERLRKINTATTLRYVAKHREQVLKQHNKWKQNKNQENKEIVLAHYGHKCACNGCGETRKEFLAVDHINGNGAEHRKEVYGKYLGMWDWLIKHNFPDGFRILCHNCNCSRGFHGYCPHQIETGEITAVQAKELKNVQVAKTHKKRTDNAEEKRKHEEWLS